MSAGTQSPPASSAGRIASLLQQWEEREARQDGDSYTGQTIRGAVHQCRLELTKALAADAALISDLAGQLSLTVLIFGDVLEKLDIDPEGTKLSLSHRGRDIADVTFADILAKGIRLVHRAEGRAEQ